MARSLSWARMDPDQDPHREEIQDPAGEFDAHADRISRLRAAMTRFDSEPSLLSVARGIRRRLPGDAKFGIRCRQPAERRSR